MNEDCAGHLATLLRLAESGEEIPTGVREHLTTCSECPRLLDAMNRMYGDVDAAEPPAIEEPVVEQTVERSAAA
ncbi:MAG: hypothetical protein QOH21_1712, partial [Acidobacteriota bacterium]|nr:hypothetical protein [Acidobacteriota bacterium]